LLEWAASGISGLTVGTTTITSGTTTRVLYDNAGVVGEYAISGTGSVAMTNAPTFSGLTSTSDIAVTGISSRITTSGANGNIEATGGGSIVSELGTIQTNGPSGIIATSGDDASISTSGEDAHIYTNGNGSYIQTSHTFNLSNGTHVTTLSHAPTANRAIVFPDAAGTIALNETISGGTLAGSFLTLAVNGKSLTLGANLTTTGTDLPTFAFPSAATARTYTFPTTTATLARTDAGQTFTATSGTPNTFAGSGNTVRFDTGVVFTYDVTVANAYANVFLTPGGVSGTAAAPVFRIWAGGTGTGMYGTGYENLSFTTASTRRGGWSSTGAFDLTGTLAVTGATTLTGLLTANGGITVVGGAKLLTTNTALTDNAGANTATLDNSPITGNPTKWIAINDNGTTRYIPTWS
jgi:hypothetical protein